MTSGLVLGNDIVDLEGRRVRGKSSSRRFMARIFAPTERSRILTADDPDLELWTAWAAKEAAFKVATKCRGHRPVFTHAAFVTQPGSDDSYTGSVLYDGERYPYAVTRSDRWLHVTGWTPGFNPGASVHTGVQTVDSTDQANAPGSVAFERLRQQAFTQRERVSVQRPASARVRMAARASVAKHLSMDEARLEIICGPGALGRTPPLLLLDGEPSGMDVSLSHHGRFVAWAFAPRLH